MTVLTFESVVRLRTLVLKLQNAVCIRDAVDFTGRHAVELHRKIATPRDRVRLIDPRLRNFFPIEAIGGTIVVCVIASK